MGDARRRRERRFRVYMRYARRSVAMALAESQHHSAQRLKMARAGEWGSEQNFTATMWKTPLPSLWECRDALWSTWLTSVPSNRFSMHLCRRWGISCWRSSGTWTLCFKISQDRIQQRLVDRDLRHPQMAEQLVEVPTVLSPSLLRQLCAEQIDDIPVRRGGLQGYRPGQIRTASSSSLAADEAFQGFFSHFSPKQKKGGGHPAGSSLSRLEHHLTDAGGCRPCP